MKLTLQPDMHDYKPVARLYWWAIAAAGWGVIVYSTWRLLQQPTDVVVIAIAGAALAALVGLFPVHIPILRSSFACGDIFSFLVLLLAGVPGAVLASAAEGFVGAVRTSKRWTSRLISPANTAIWMLVCGTALESLLPAVGRVLPEPLSELVALMVFGLLYFMLNVGGVRFFFALKNGKPVRFLAWWRENYLVGLWFVASATLAGLIHLGLQQLGWGTLLVAMPMLLMFLSTYYALERTAEISRRKSEFLAHMSHELRTPLNAIIGGSEVLKDGFVGPLTPRQVQWASDIHESGEHLLAVINDILDISKIEAGRMEIERKRVDVNALVASAVTLVKGAAARRGVELASEIATDVGEIGADERKLKQVLLNLLSNAIKFTPEGGRVTVTGRREAGAIAIAVRDTGIGIAAEDQAAAFDAFRQVGKDAAAKAIGTGLGLTLARDLVVLHGGTLALDSEPGRGSVFTVRLPDNR